MDLVGWNWWDGTGDTLTPYTGTSEDSKPKRHSISKQLTIQQEY